MLSNQGRSVLSAPKSNLVGGAARWGQTRPNIALHLFPPLPVDHDFRASARFGYSELERKGHWPFRVHNDLNLAFNWIFGLLFQLHCDAIDDPVETRRLIEIDQKPVRRGKISPTGKIAKTDWPHAPATIKGPKTPVTPQTTRRGIEVLIGHIGKTESGQGPVRQQLVVHLTLDCVQKSNI